MGPQHSPRPGHALNRLWTPSDAHSPSGSGVTVLPGQQDRWNVARLLLWLHFQHLPIPQRSVVGMLFPPPCHLNGLSGVSVAECGEPVPSPFLSGQVRLRFLWPYQTPCFQNCYSATWEVELNFSLLTSSQLRVIRKAVDHSEVSIFSILCHLPCLTGISPGNFVSYISYCLVVIWPSLLRA